MKTKLTYTNINGINYPNLQLSEQTTVTIGKYGHLRLDYLKKHRRGTYTTLLTTCKLNEHLADIDAEASQCVRELTEAFARADGLVFLKLHVIRGILIRKPIIKGRIFTEKYGVKL